MNARTLAPILMGTLVWGFSTLSVAEEQHGQKAIQHLEQAVESGQQGNAAAAGQHAGEAQKHAIQQNKAHPYRKSPKKIAGENPKQEYDEQAFGALQKAEGHAQKGHAEEAGKAAGQAEEHLKEKEQVK